MSYWITIGTALISCAIAALTGIVLIPFLKKIHFGQTILEIGPKWHKSKQGTPIMGGFMFIISSIIAVIIGYLLYRSRNMVDITEKTASYNAIRLLACILFSVLFSGIGFLDDYIKAVKKQNLGLNPKQKMIFQFILSAAFLAVLYALGDKSTKLDLIFFQLDLGIFYYPIMILFMIYVSNAVNLTDGVDGLCGSVTFVTMLAFFSCMWYNEILRDFNLCYSDCRRLSGISDLESSSCKMLYGRYRFNVSGWSVCGDWSDNSQASAYGSCGTCIHS